MSTDAQIAANKSNSRHSTGPNTEEGKASSCRNNFRWGFCGAFTILPSEDAEEYGTLVAGLHAEHQPRTVTETILVEKMAQHHWLGQRAMHLQNMTMEEDLPIRDQDRRFALFLRYQTTNDRAFHKCLNDLLKLRAEKRRAEIGFESQRRQQADLARKESIEKRKQELHRIDVLLAEAKLDHQSQVNSHLEFVARRQQREAALEKAA